MKQCNFCKHSYLINGTLKCIYGKRCALSYQELKELTELMQKKSDKN